jgi:hypothetical protein
MKATRLLQLLPLLLLGSLAPSDAQTAKKPFPDVVQEAQTPRPAPTKRREQQKNEHDNSDVFDSAKAPLASSAEKGQPDDGEVRGFDFFRDPLNAKKPGQKPEEIEKEDRAMKDAVMAAQRKLLEKRYDLNVKTDPAVKMSRGKLVPIGPTARIPKNTTGMNWRV